MVVRFGNVIGSRGSIVPLFNTQILKGGPVTVTHPDTTRFFMTIPEAVSLVLKAGGVGTGGHLYILDMGEPQSVRELAEQMIKFYGFTPNEEIPIKYVGLRPGEKLHESLWASHETMIPTEHPGIHRLERGPEKNGDMWRLLDDLTDICFYNETRPELYRNRRVLRSVVRKHFPTVKKAENEPEY
jgi:FlaA1/EpsC-like NDP-sugar epimerase